MRERHLSSRQVSIVDEIESILQISQPDLETQRLCQNAWSYHCARRRRPLHRPLTSR